ncbi:hypothetical protein LOAG_08608 [Loa loa]|uniref:protein-tyrosine-phosphatase n=1 Tax=Loa loa TaxID=7209 RepID=A0A1S0TTG8_LOALO|nr:hypothetical protein LOAG_08608 [Loa loa]EFO19886.1 hypothetical protein LOAG_08608 [Loa loa]
MTDDSLCPKQNDSDIEMNELQIRFNQTLGKRFSVAQQDVREDVQQPLIKRRKEGEKKQLEREAENSKKEQSKENGAERADEKMDYFCESKYSLVTVQKPGILTAGFACIEKVVLKQLLKSMKPQEFIEKYALIDCRYPYEYEGGHIKGALNIYDPVELENTFFPKCSAAFKIMLKKFRYFTANIQVLEGQCCNASHLRKSDRVRNYANYPFLYYNEIYVLQGGYNSFYSTDDDCFKDLCEPTGYVSMRDKKHSYALKIYHTRSIRNGVGFETGMFQTAVIRKNDFRRTYSVPQMPESPTASEFSSARSPEKFHPECSTIPMLANPRTPTGRKNSR